MSDDQVSLAQLRQQIDDLDDKLHDLLMERTLIVRQVAAAKALDSGADDAAPHGVQALAMRPGREAAVIRRLVGRHSGELPRLVVASLWRELMTAKTRLQAPLRVCVYGGHDKLAFWDLARFYYGSPTPLESIDKCEDILAKVRSDASMIGLLPQPTGQEFKWWIDFQKEDTNDPIHIVTRLPFLLGGGQTRPLPTAYVIGPIEPEATGDDSSVVRLTLPPDHGHHDAKDLLQRAGIKGRVIARHRSHESLKVLVEIAGFLTSEDETLQVLKESPICTSLSILGAFANPLPLSDGSNFGEGS